MLRKIVSWVLVGLGAFLLVLAVLATAWAPGVLMKTPKSIETTTRLEGSGEKFNPATSKVEPIEVKVTSLTQTDSDRSTDTNVVWASTTCVVLDENDPPDCVDEDDDRLVSATVEVFASNRVTGLAVGDREGLVNKWPFNAEKKTYPYWDGMLGEPLDAVYEGSETIQGVETYHFVVSAEDRPAEVTEGIDGIYTTKKDIWVEPVTGSIVNQVQYERRTLEDGTVLIDMTVGFTDEQVKTSAEESKTNVAGLKLLTKTVPLVGFIGGPLLIIAGVLLGRRKKADA